MLKHVLLLGLTVLALGSWQARSASHVAFQSVTDWGDPTKLTGALSKPPGEGPFPAVVMLHPCSGMSAPTGAQWEKRLLEWGYVVLQVDSFASRGLKNVCKYETTGSYDEDVFESDTRVEDAYGGKQYLSNLPYVLKDRIGLIGWAHGGAAVMHTLITGPPPASFAAAVAVYPSCGIILAEINAPLLILVGKNDTWSVAAVCEQLEQPSMGTHKFERIVYPGAHHGFDEEGADRKYLGHRILHDPVAASETNKRAKAFFAKHLK